MIGLRPHPTLFDPLPHSQLRKPDLRYSSTSYFIRKSTNAGVDSPASYPRPPFNLPHHPTQRRGTFEHYHRSISGCRSLSSAAQYLDSHTVLQEPIQRFLHLVNSYECYWAARRTHHWVYAVSLLLLFLRPPREEG